MSNRRLFTLSLVLPVTAMAGTAYAGSTITDRNYWPAEIHAQAQRGAVTRDAELSKARAMAVGAPAVYPSAATTGRQQQCRYQGGPKSTATCVK